MWTICRLLTKYISAKKYRSVYVSLFSLSLFAFVKGTRYTRSNLGENTKNDMPPKPVVSTSKV